MIWQSGQNYKRGIRVEHTGSFQSNTTHTSDNTDKPPVSDKWDLITSDSYADWLIRQSYSSGTNVNFTGVYEANQDHISSSGDEPPNGPWTFIHDVKINKDIQGFEPDRIVELIELDLTSLGGDILRFHNSHEYGDGIIQWGDPAQSYAGLPYSGEGFEVDSSGKMPTPRIQLSNVGGALTSQMKLYDDFARAKVSRYHVFVKNLWSRDDPDPNVYLGKDVYFIERKTSQTLFFVEWELSSAIDVEGVMLPRGYVSADNCLWKYRDIHTCQWRGVPVSDVHNVQFISNTTFKQDHDPRKNYVVNDLVQKFFPADGKTHGYKCIQNVSSGSVNNDVSNTSYFTKVLNDRGNWATGQIYAQGDYVNLSGSIIKRLFYCDIGHTSSDDNKPPSIGTTINWKEDSCSNTLFGCKLRYGDGPYPARLFPGSEQMPR